MQNELHRIEKFRAKAYEALIRARKAQMAARNTKSLIERANAYEEAARAHRRAARAWLRYAESGVRSKNRNYALWMECWHRHIAYTCVNAAKRVAGAGSQNEEQED